MKADRDGLYTIQARVGSAFADRTFHIDVDGADVTGSMVVPQVADWDLYETVSIAGVALQEGIHEVRVVMGPADFMDLQWIAFVEETTGLPPGPFAGNPWPIPGRIEAEDYDVGGQGIGNSIRHLATSRNGSSIAPMMWTSRRRAKVGTRLGGSQPGSGSLMLSTSSTTASTRFRPVWAPLSRVARSVLR